MDRMEGQRFGRLVVLRRAGSHVRNGGQKNAQYLCRCDCGKEVIVQGYLLRNGHTRSCGCLRVETALNNRPKRPKGGPARTKWRSLMQSHPGEICPEWANDFNAFREWMEQSGFKAGQWIWRIDRSKPYGPENCIWYDANSWPEVVEAHGEKHTVEEWAEITGLKVSTIRHRMYSQHWVPEDAVSCPKGYRRARKA